MKMEKSHSLYYSIYLIKFHRGRFVFNVASKTEKCSHLSTCLVNGFFDQSFNSLSRNLGILSRWPETSGQ